MKAPIESRGSRCSSRSWWSPALTAVIWVNMLGTATPALAQKQPAPEPQLALPTDTIDLVMPDKTIDLVVHEWGTFLSMSSADGTAIDGMYHEEHALPPFVHGRSRDQLRLPFMFLKGETPVIYFYTKEKQNVRVGVGFRRGIWTQWYPQAAVVLPNLLTQAEQSGSLHDGRICWVAEVIPHGAMPQHISKRSGAVPEIDQVLPETSADALWNHAREVDAAFVRTTDATQTKPTSEFERFLFYRGLGEARLPLHIQESGRGTLKLDAEPGLADGVRDLFVLRVEGGRGAYTYLPSLRPGQIASDVIPSMSQSLPLAEFTTEIADDLAARLAQSGLFSKEARAMVNTWKTSYFQTDGIRVLFVLPQAWTDAFIPMRIQPQPRKIVRVMVGRLEMLSADRQRKAEAAIASLASGNPGETSQAYRFLRDQGRYVEPIIRHVARTTPDEHKKALCERLLLTDFVTDLRAAIHNASDGKKLNVDPTLLRAQLSRLLRQMGQDSQARSEGKAALEALRTYPLPPNQKIEDSMPATEIKAAALEGMGLDREAADVYVRRIEQFARMMGPDFAQWQVQTMRDWWVGRAYGQCVARSGQSSAIEKSLRDQISQPSTAGTDLARQRMPRFLLAYLLEGQGKEILAVAQWESMVSRPAGQTASGPAPQQDVPTKTGI